jgi:hypothetical protein
MDDMPSSGQALLRLARGILAPIALVLCSSCRDPDPPSAELPRIGSLIYSDTVDALAPSAGDECLDCRITLEPLGTIGSVNDTVHPVFGATVSQGTDQRFYVAKISERGRVGVYSMAGDLIEILGRYGEGPGEMRTVSTHATTADSELVVLAAARILRFPLPSGEPRSRLIPYFLNLPKMIALPGGGLVVNNRHPNARNFVYFGPEDSDILTFGDSTGASSRDGSDPVRREALGLQLLAPVDSAHFWSVRQFFSPVLDEWGIDGRLLRRYQLPAPWFAEYGTDEFQSFIREGIRVSPIPIVTGIHRDSDGRLWTVTQVADPDWTAPDSAEQARREDGGLQAVPWGFDLRPVVDAIIAVYDISPAGAKLVATGRFDIPIRGILSDSIAYDEEIPERDVMTFSLYRFRMQVPPSERSNK